MLDTDKFLIIVLNGPSKVGKTTIADKLAGTLSHPYGILNGRHFVCWHEKMINPVREAVMAMFSLDQYTFESAKDDKILINDMSPREAVIAADICIRRALGNGYLAEILALELMDSIRKSKSFQADKPWNIYLVDAGVQAEVNVLRNRFKHRVKVLHVFRNGIEFNDDRHWVEPTDAVVDNVDGQLNQTIDKILLFINGWMEGLSDKVNHGVTPRVPEESQSNQPQS